MQRASTHTVRLDPSLMGVYDAIHGSIDLRDAALAGQGSSMLVRLISRPLMERLRRLKLLGYASHTYPAADHSRYAHALGSMHVMRLLLHQVGHVLQRDKTLLPALQVFGQPKIKTFEQFVQHMLVATLLQDTGDLPYSQATARVLCPKAALRKWVANKMGVSDATAWDTKHIFTIASVFKDECFAASGLNHQFIGFLITGHFSGGGGS